MVNIRYFRYNKPDSDLLYMQCDLNQAYIPPKPFITSKNVKTLFLIFLLIWSIGYFSLRTLIYFEHFPQDLREDLSGQRAQPQIQPVQPTSCDRIPDEEKFDCYPRGVSSEDSCTARGCCWSPKNETDKIPWCFYPRNYQTYKVVNISTFERGMMVLMNNTRQSSYPKDVKTLQMKITFETQFRIHVKIIDFDHMRYEPPYPEVPLVGGIFRDDYDYDVQIDNKTFGFAIIRKDNGKVIFDTRGIGGFIYSDQFLQLSAIIPSKYIYGLGEKRNNFLLNANWEQITLFNFANPPTDHMNIYGTHPFYLSIEEAASADEEAACHGVFFLNSNAMDIILQPAPAITYRTIGGVLDFYFFMGPSPADVVKQYMEVIGYPFLPPYWSLGFHLSKFGLKSVNETRAFWERNKNTGIPFEVQWNDIDYMNSRNDFTVSPAYSGLKDFIDEIHKCGMKYVIILDPGVASRLPTGTYSPYDEGLRQKIFITNSSGQPMEGVVWNLPKGTVFPDFTNPKVIPYWLKLVNELHLNVPFDGLWIDMNEIENFVDGSTQGCPEANNTLDYPPYVPNVQGGNLNHHTLCMSAKLYAGSNYNVHNIYSLAEAIVTNFCLTTVTGKRPFLLSRSTFAGSGRFTAHWTGDVYSTWDDMRHSVIDIMNFNLFGIPMVGADICGFNNNATKQLCQRWHQLGAFYPFSRNHNSDDTIEQDPAIWGPDLIESTKKALILRYTFLPYLYTLFYSAHKYGDPVVRPLFFEFLEDPVTYGENTQFFWGPALLIVPVLTENATSVMSYFPKSTWFDVYTLELHRSNGDYITLTAPLDKIPLFIRAGFVITFQEPATTTEASRKNPFGLHVALDDDNLASGLLYWDDGDNYEFEDGDKYNLIRFECDGTTLSGLVSNRGYETTMVLDTINVLGISGQIKSIVINNEPHTNFTSFYRDQRLEIRNARIPMLDSFNVTWT